MKHVLFDEGAIIEHSSFNVMSRDAYVQAGLPKWPKMVVTEIGHVYGYAVNPKWPNFPFRIESFWHSCTDLVTY